MKSRIGVWLLMPVNRDESHRSKPSQDGGMILAGCCPVDMNNNTTMAIIPLCGLPVHFPGPAPAGSRVILNRQGFLSSTVGQLTTMKPARNLTAPAFWPYSDCLQETKPRLPGTTSIVWCANRDGNWSEQLALPIESSGPSLFSPGGDRHGTAVRKRRRRAPGRPLYGTPQHLSDSFRGAPIRALTQ